MNTEPTKLYFIQKKNEYVTFMGQLILWAMQGVMLGLEVFYVKSNQPPGVPDFLTQSGIWVEYSDGNRYLMEG